MSTGPNYQVETVVKRNCDSIGEGPHWDERTRTLLYVDIHDGVVHRWSEDTGREDTHTFGTMGLEASPAVVEQNQGSLFSLETDGTIRVRKEWVSISNGLAWSADNKTMYYIDSLPRKVYAYNFDLTSGNISNERVCVDFGEEDTMASLGYPDGMAIDTDGMLWVACYSAGRVVRFDPNSGIEIDSVSIPARRTTSCSLCGKKFDEMFVTCSRYGLTKDEEKTTPLAGSLFRVTGLGVKGLPAPIYEG